MCPDLGPDAPAKQSALQTARLRAVHQFLDQPLIFEDPLALRILGPEEEARLRADPGRWNQPLLRVLRASVVARSRLAEDEWAAARTRGVDQYVVLGAGLDTSALRHPERGRIIEADLPAMQEWKRGLLRAAQIAEPGSLRFAALDLERHSLDRILAQAGLDQHVPALVAWLGVSMYLDQGAVAATLACIGALAPGSGVVLDYAVDPALLTERERAGLDFLRTRTADRGEPWKTFFQPADLAALFRAQGFSEVQDLGPEEINERYFQNRTDGLRKGGVSRLALARV